MAKFKKPRKILVAPPNPDDGWNDPPISRDGTVEQCLRIRKKIKEASPAVWKRAFRFFEEVDAKVAAIHETLQASAEVSKGQKSALDGWERGIDKWLAPRT